MDSFLVVVVFAIVVFVVVVAAAGGGSGQPQERSYLFLKIFDKSSHSRSHKAGSGSSPLLKVRLEDCLPLEGKSSH